MLGSAKVTPFQLYPDRYERWFEEHQAAYVSELLALRSLVPWQLRGLEIGVGTGRFAAPLGVSVGIDPAPAMLERAAARGIQTARGVAEDLPFADASFDYALVVTTLCFVESPRHMMAEARRVIRPGGKLLIGFVDRETDLGRSYMERRSRSAFYREAILHSADEVERLLRQARFAPQTWGQTLSQPLSRIVEPEPVRQGTGEGAFVVVSAERMADDGPQIVE